MINESIFDEIKESQGYKDFRKHYIMQAIYPLLLSIFFTFIMFLLMDEPNIISIIPCIFMIIAVCTTAVYAIKSFLPPTVVERGIIKEVLIYKQKNDTTETNYIVDVFGQYYKVKGSTPNKSAERIYQKGDEVIIIVYGNNKIGYIIPRDENVITSQEM